MNPLTDFKKCPKCEGKHRSMKCSKAMQKGNYYDIYWECPECKFKLIEKEVRII